MESGSHFSFSHRGCDLCRAVRTDMVEEMILAGFEPPVLQQQGKIFLMSALLPVRPDVLS